jgi:UDP-N-acetylmuramoyl-tripeptide--D-alanyl-D-alanine ligase
MKEVLAATGGKLAFEGASSGFSAISTDSRRIKAGELFIPIAGKRFDGHKFIAAALNKGAGGALTSKNIKIDPAGKAIIKVKDTLAAFHDITLAHRNKFRLPIIGITGSSGKTTTKDMLASILSKAGKTLKTEENFNNEIGVPQTLLKLKKSIRFAVIEMAMQGLGEIEELARMSRPNIAVITNIGIAHFSRLKSEDNIARAKSELLKFQKKKDIAVLPADDKYFNLLKKRSRSRIISFGIDGEADVKARGIEYGSDFSSFILETDKFSVSIDLPLPGKHNIYDALAAAAAAYALDIKPGLIKKGLESFKLSGKRLNIIAAKHFRIIDDTYNANPDSMAASLNILENYPGRRIAVLGDMLELGAIARKSHENIGELAANLNIDVLITVGKLGEFIASSAKKHGMAVVHSKRTTGEALKLLKKISRPDDTILVKGSRGMHMEKIVEIMANN